MTHKETKMMKNGKVKGKWQHGMFKNLKWWLMLMQDWTEYYNYPIKMTYDVMAQKNNCDER